MHLLSQLHYLSWELDMKLDLFLWNQVSGNTNFGWDDDDDDDDAVGYITEA